MYKDRSARSQAAETDVVKQHGSGNTVEFSCGTAAQGKSRNVLSVAWMRKDKPLCEAGSTVVICCKEIDTFNVTYR